MQTDNLEQELAEAGAYLRRQKKEKKIAVMY